ncbi:MAG TPA: AraC family transcriptional regulator [Clostridiales bacterium]|nr:AraC family transcriptional regulator [Clostridiales bacterium]
MLSLDFDILWVSKCTYPAKHVIKKNYHDYYQIVFILNGEGEIILGNNAYNTSVNQVYIFKPNVEHSIKASRFKLLNIVEVKFYCNNTISESLVYQLPSIIKDTGQSIRTAFVNIVEEVKMQDKYTEYIINSLFTQIIFFLVRISETEPSYSCRKNIDRVNYKDDRSIRNEKEGDEPLTAIIDYIMQNYFMEIKLIDLAEIVYLSPIYFCSIFKERYGVSPIQYLQSVRLENAKKLLIDTNNSITTISERVGFQSVNYFSRYFKTHEGITPNEFRRRNQNFIIKDFRGDITDFS